MDGLENHRLVLASRPQGHPVPDNFRLEVTRMPGLQVGQMLLRTRYLSIDPYMRGRMSDAPSYAPPVALGDVMVGGTVCEVVESRHPEYAEGEIVLAYTGWQTYAISDGSGLLRLGELPHPSLALGVLGMPGFTAYMGLMDIGAPQSGETVVVAAASGAVGAVVGQLARLQGCRVVGIAGGSDKCRYVTDELGFDVCLDRRAVDLGAQLAAACPRGIDIYFESVGGAVFDAVLPLLNARARIPLCGLVSQYNATSLPNGPDRVPQLMATLLKRRIRMQGFIIFDDYGPRFPEFQAIMRQLVEKGDIRFREDVVEGLEAAPQALIDLLEGKNFGKLVVKID